MGTVTPNISIYIPAAGETNYDTAFASGMVNVDQHDHSGAPNKGVPISTSGIAANSITYQLLNNNVITPGGGLEFFTPTTQNQIQVAGVLKGIFGLSSNGFIVRTGATTARAATLVGTSGQIAITNTAGAADPVFSLDSANFFLPTITKPIDITIPGADARTCVISIVQNYDGPSYYCIQNTSNTANSVAGFTATSGSVGITLNAYATGSSNPHADGGSIVCKRISIAGTGVATAGGVRIQGQGLLEFGRFQIDASNRGGYYGFGNDTQWNYISSFNNAYENAATAYVVGAGSATTIATLDPNQMWLFMAFDENNVATLNCSAFVTTGSGVTHSITNVATAGLTFQFNGASQDLQVANATGGSSNVYVSALRLW